MEREAMLEELPKAPTIGLRKNAKGFVETWRGYKLHVDAADPGVPISCLLTSASLHDSQAAIPLATLSTERVTYLYELMDAAYDSEEIGWPSYLSRSCSDHRRQHPPEQGPQEGTGQGGPGPTLRRILRPQKSALQRTLHRRTGEQPDQGFLRRAPCPRPGP